MINGMRRLIPRLTHPVIVVTLLFFSNIALADVTGWPREIEVKDKATILMYQPQLESFKDDDLTARAAVSVTPKGQKEPIFGAVWMDARVETDRETRTVTLVDVDVPTAKFPDADPAKVDKLREILKTEMPKWELSAPLDTLLAALETAQLEQRTAELVIIDGNPEMSPEVGPVMAAVPEEEDREIDPAPGPEASREKG